MNKLSLSKIAIYLAILNWFMAIIANIITKTMYRFHTEQVLALLGLVSKYLAFSIAIAIVGTIFSVWGYFKIKNTKILLIGLSMNVLYILLYLMLAYLFSVLIKNG